MIIIIACTAAFMRHPKMNKTINFDEITGENRQKHNLH